MKQQRLTNAFSLFLKLLLLLIFAWWAWNEFSGINQYLMTVGLPLTLAGVWGLLHTGGRSGNRISNLDFKLVYEVLLFACASCLLVLFGKRAFAYAFAIISVVYFLLSYPGKYRKKAYE